MKNASLIAGLSIALLAVVAATPAQEIVTINNTLTGETLTHNKLFVPEGTGPFPAVVVMHGSGGLWSDNDVASEEMSQHFEEWADTFVDAGYIALFVDSYTDRGIVEFRSKRPSDNPLVDDSAASDRAVRNKDADAALAWLQARADVIDNKVALMGFSQGAQGALSAVLSPTVPQYKNTWTISKEVLQADGTYKKQTVSATAPYTISPANGFATTVAYYPGAGFNSYYGSSSATAAKLYMPYCPTLMIHGDQDPLHTDAYYTTALKNKSASHATFLGRAAQTLPIAGANGQNVTTSNPLYHELVPGLGHSFDELESGDAGFDDMVATRAKVLAWLEFYLN